jgi:O-acetyl-ADP-ribose deacetylase (regulator of RNase III)
MVWVPKGKEILHECKKLAQEQSIKVGQVYDTTGYLLEASRVIHAISQRYVIFEDSFVI